MCIRDRDRSDRLHFIHSDVSANILDNVHFPLFFLPKNCGKCELFWKIVRAVLQLRWINPHNSCNQQVRDCTLIWLKWYYTSCELSDEPIKFLTDLLDRCVEYREGYNKIPPLLFEDKHILSLYRSLDPLECGTITYAQYKIGKLCVLCIILEHHYIFCLLYTSRCV